MGENCISGLIHTILYTFDTAFAEKLTKCLVLQGFEEIFSMQYNHFSFFDPSGTQYFSYYLFITIQTFFGVFRQPKYILGGRTSVSLKTCTNYDRKI